MIYCTYLTTYKGNKLPPFYIGHSTVERINKGYHGSVKSKIYKIIWEQELKNNPQSFKTKIITNHSTRQEALNKELKFLIKLNAVNNLLYTNKGAWPYFDRRGQTHTKETKLKMSIAAKGNTRGKANKNRKRPDMIDRNKERCIGLKATKETRYKMSLSAQQAWKKRILCQIQY